MGWEQAAVAIGFAKKYIDQAIINNVRFQVDTTENWNKKIGFIPKTGEAIVYSDHRSFMRDGELVFVPGLKIGNGSSFLQNLPFTDNQCDTIQSDLEQHKANTNMHTNAYEKSAWNEKVSTSVNGEILIFSNS